MQVSKYESQGSKQIRNILPLLFSLVFWGNNGDNLGSVGVNVTCQHLQVEALEDQAHT